MGIYGFSTGNAGIVGETANPNSFAGFFAGNAVVTGTLTAGVKNAMVAFPDGSQRVLHCMESPEHWFEDFGTAKLRNGRAVVRLDADFANVIKRGDYRVFVTPEGDCRGLYVRRKSAARFEVRELAGGKSNVAFSYRIVGRRKDIRRHRRFAKIDTRLEMHAGATRGPRKRAPSAAELRTFVARLEKEARERAPTRASEAEDPARFQRFHGRLPGPSCSFPRRRRKRRNKKVISISLPAQTSIGSCALRSAWPHAPRCRDSGSLSGTHHAFGSVR
jgi:hypothetical protein